MKFLVDTPDELEAVQQIVTKTLAISLLGHKKPKPPQNPNDTIAFGQPFYMPDSMPSED